ncbi:MAG: plastocyanin/azurin family copper-binding protein [Acidobacteriota bacterium]|nr:plastocyanin/azurin family copper-binding protein [Acidobacteriota bacterium]
MQVSYSRFRYLCKAICLVIIGTFSVTNCGNSVQENTAVMSPAVRSDPAESGDGRTISGTAPTSTDGSLTVVLLEPRTSQEFSAPDEPVQMDQLGMEFLPPVLLATIGQPVHFHNGEDILHNVRVYNIDTKETAFNISTPIGGTYEHFFDTAGTYRVACDIHPQMGASVVVSATPYATVAERNGRFTLDNISPGQYTATIQAGPDRSQRSVTISADTTELNLTDN